MLLRNKSLIGKQVIGKSVNGKSNFQKTIISKLNSEKPIIGKSNFQKTIISKSIFVLSIFFLIIIFTAVFAAASCEEQLMEINSTKNFRDHLKVNLYNYLANPVSAQLDLNLSELNATIKFFTGIPGNINASVICGASATSSNVSSYGGINISQVVTKFLVKPPRNVVPRCLDVTRTPYGECSVRKPVFCYSGKLVPMCAGSDRILNTDDDCGCLYNGTCNPTTGLCDNQCFSDSDCLPSIHYTCSPSSNYKISKVVKQTKCVSGGCTPFGFVNYSIISECANTSQYCKDNTDHCVACTNDMHCPDVTNYSCNNNNIIKTQIANLCQGESCVLQSPNISIKANCTLNSKYCVPGFDDCKYCTDDSHCPGTYFCDMMNSWIKKPACNNSTYYCGYENYVKFNQTNETCIYNCGKPIDKITPEHEFFRGADKIKIKSHKFKDIYMNPNNYFYTNITIFEYLNGTYNDNYISSCSGSFEWGCIVEWNRHSMWSNNEGNYTYYAIITNSSGKTWYLPNQDTTSSPELFCYGKFKVDIP